MKEMMGKSKDAYPQILKMRSNSRPIQRAKIIDAEGIEQALQLAALTLRPDEVSGRELIKRLMPHLYQLRKKGFSYKALTGVINDAIGDPCAKLQPNTIKTYYNEFIVERLDECSEHLKKHVQLMAEIEKSTAKSPQELIAEGTRLRSIMTGARDSAATAASDRILSGQKNHVASLIIPVPEAVVAPLALPTAKKTERPPALRPAVAAAPSEPILNAEIGADGLVIPGVDSLIDPPIVLAETTAAQSNQGPAQIPSVPIIGHETTLLLVCMTHPVASTMHLTTSEIFHENPQEFFSEAILEHPVISALMLSKEQRFYKSRLSYSRNGVQEMESGQQMAARFGWRKGRKMTESATQADFVPMDMSLFSP